ncbi:MAG: DUF4330 family protein [Clostridia bacterium]|nr:DUF4330 family protein [Clostridia bacterium]
MAKRRFTWLDAVICGLLILALAGAAVWYFTKDSGAGVATKEYEVTLRFNRATNDEYDYYKIGDTMYFQERAAVLGTITGLKPIEKATEEYDPVNGRYVKLVDPETSAVEMTLRVQGAVIDGEFTVNGETFHIGQEFYPQSDTTRSVMFVWDIEEVAA